MSRFEARISITSTEFDLRSIEKRLGVLSDASGASKGDWSRSRADHVYPWSSWRKKLSWSCDSHPGTEGLDHALSSLSMELADSIHGLVSDGCEAGLTILQELGDESNGWDCGFYLGVDALDWLVRARVSIGIDQYVLSEDDGDEEIDF